MTARLPGLDLLRALAIAWVMLFHSFLVGGLGPDFAWLQRYGWMGVDIFFVLSGYLIGRQVLAPLARGERLDFGRFYARRAYRILPAFAVVLAIYLLWPAGREAEGLAPWWQFATFTLNFTIDYQVNQAFSHAWSLCVEEHFYLLFPALAWALAVRWPSARRVAALVTLLVIGGVLLRAAIWWHFAETGIERNWFVEEIYYPTYARLDGLLAGVVLALIATYRPAWWAGMAKRADAMALAGLAGLALALWLFRERTGVLGNTLGWPVLSAALAALVASAATGRGVLGTLRLPGAAWIATISYSLYLSHKLVFQAVSANFDAQLDGAGLLAFFAYAAATVAAGALLHYAVERPFLRLRERRERRASPPPPVEAEFKPVAAAAPVPMRPVETDAVAS
jgi:peptidoglycan/LPS O-acetylase OafA/YrhL